MKYLRIASKSRTNSVDMFTLGVSTSRGKEDKIGQFGSGTLLGTLCWMRNEGDSPIFGINGSRIEFECVLTKKSDGETFRQVFRCENGERIPLSVSLEYGEIDWPDAHMGLREWISNAVDNGAVLDDGESIKTVDESEMDFPEDSVIVYVPMSGFVKKYFNNIDKYFLHFLGLEKKQAIKKDKATTCRVYRRGVFIREMDFKSVFDYNLDFNINESRNGSSDSIRSDILGMCVGSGIRPDKEYVEHLTYHIRCNSDCIEVRESNWYENLYGTAWKEFLNASDFKVHSGHQDGEGDNVQPHWYKRFINTNPHLDGMAHLTKAVQEGHIVLPPTKELEKMASDVWLNIDLCGLAGGKELPKLELFKTRDGSQPQMLGAYDKRTETVSIWENAVNRETLLHEFAHYLTGADDYSRRFTDFFTRMCVELMKLTN